MKTRRRHLVICLVALVLIVLIGMAYQAASWGDTAPCWSHQKVLCLDWEGTAAHIVYAPTPGGVQEYACGLGDGVMGCFAFAREGGLN